MNFSFGPWTTAIDSGSRAQLSAFWKKRIGMLSGLVAASPRVSRSGWVLLLAAGMLALGWPTLYFSRTVVAATGPSEQREPAVESPQKAGQQKPRPTVPGGPVLVPLPGGVTAELIGLADHTAKKKSWWAPDGTPIAAPYQKFRSRANPGAGQIAREIAVRFHVPQDADVATGWNVTPCSAFAGGRAYDEDGTWIRSVDAGAAVLPATQLTGTITFRVAAGDWETVAETNGKGYSARGERKHGFVFTPAYQLDGSVMITISHTVVGKDVRIIAVGADGKMLAIGKTAGGGSRGFMQTTCIFKNLSLEDVHLFQLQARPYHRVEIRDVALRKEQGTKPTIVDLGEDKEKE